MAWSNLKMAIAMKMGNIPANMKMRISWVKYVSAMLIRNSLGSAK